MTDIFPGAILRQLREWGYPMGSPRPVPAAGNAFSVVHITGNRNLPSADSELSWRINDPGLQNSATFFVNRDGSIRQALGDPLRMDPWANGDVNNPDMSNLRIAAMVRDRVNANERTIVAIENVGYEPGYSITAAQERANARIIAYYHAKAGVPVTRQTVIGHYQLNSTSRPNCPAVNKAVLDRIVALATPQEEDMILAPIELFPEGTVAGFNAGGITYSLYRIKDGAIQRDTLTTEATSGTAALAGGRVALNGDSAHSGIYILNGMFAGWVVSGYGPQPTIIKPEPEVIEVPTGITPAQLAAAKAAGRAEGIQAARADLADLK